MLTAHGVLLPFLPALFPLLFYLQDGLAERLAAGEIPTKICEAPFVQIPLGVTEDRLVGTVDIEASMKVRGLLEQLYNSVCNRMWSPWVPACYNSHATVSVTVFVTVNL
jgi:hypothetical protein